MTKEFILALIGQSRAQLISTFLAVPDDKLSWKPLENGRCALELFSEAAVAFVGATQFVVSKGEDKPFLGEFKALAAESKSWTKEEALAAMETNFAEFIAAVNEVSEEDLQKPITMPFGPGMTAPMGVWAMIPHRACVSRFAQINYIQTLYGDFEGH
ncbi:DinB family protein [bacterium]|nr:MAG: DinB family protein [bacterium]